MRKWIKSKHGYDMVELLNNVVCVTCVVDEECNEVVHWLECNSYQLGVYESEARCVEILNEIEQFIMSKDEIVFVMPNE